MQACIIINIDENYFLRVKDDGIGVPDETKLFKLFETTKETGKGIGLVGALNIIRIHNGDLSFSGLEGKYKTEFTIRLPIPYDQQLER